MANEKILLALGEKKTLSAGAGIKDDANRLAKDGKGSWGSTGSCAVINSDDLEKDSVEVVGSSVGKCVVYFRQNAKLTDAEAISTGLGGGGADRLRQIEDQYVVAFDVEVVAKKDAQGKAVAAAAAPGSSSSKFDGLLPMTESQKEASEKTPYGMDQFNRPVAPFPGMVSPTDDSTVARQSEDAVAKGTPAAAAKPAEPAKAASKAVVPPKAPEKPAAKTDKK